MNGRACAVDFSEKMGLVPGAGNGHMAFPDLAGRGYLYVAPAGGRFK
jgi:hypothetical protein